MDNFSLDDFKLLIFDMDGVIYAGSRPIESAITSIKRFRSLGKKIVFFTNNSTIPRESYVEKLKKFKIETTQNEIYSSSAIAAGFLKEKFIEARAFVVGEDGLITTFANAGFKVINCTVTLDEIISDNNITTDFVICGLDRKLTYEKIAAASQLISRGSKFYATNSDATLPTEFGLLPGAGIVLNAIQTSVGYPPLEIFGKPSPVGIELILKDFNVDKSEAVMIGDRIDTDILCGNTAGIKTMLVLTGASQMSDLEKADKKSMPDMVIKDLTEF